MDNHNSWVKVAEGSPGNINEIENVVGSVSADVGSLSPTIAALTVNSKGLVGSLYICKPF